MIDLSERNGLIKCFDSNHKFAFLNNFILQHIGIFFVDNEVLVVKVLDGLVKYRDHFSREVNKLKIKFPVELLDMLSLNNKHVSFIKVKSAQLSVIYFLRNHLSINFICNLEVSNECLQTVVNLPS